MGKVYFHTCGQELRVSGRFGIAIATPEGEPVDDCPRCGEKALMVDGLVSPQQYLATRLAEMKEEIVRAAVAWHRARIGEVGDEAAEYARRLAGAELALLRAALQYDIARIPER